MVGIVPTAEAQRMAREAGLDLVEVAPNARPPVCKILDYGKWKYQQQKKEQKARSHSKAGQLKELKLKTVRIGEHDLQIKINHARDFLEEGNKVQFTLQFRGREMAHLDLGHKLFRTIKEQLFTCSKVERDDKMKGRRMTLVLQPDHKPRPTGGQWREPQPPAPPGTRARTRRRQIIPRATRSTSRLPQLGWGSLFLLGCSTIILPDVDRRRI
jgi:translation initiation factor IF-3